MALRCPINGTFAAFALGCWSHLVMAATTRAGPRGRLLDRDHTDFLDAAQLDRDGAFSYSPVEGAAANALPGALPDEIREERKARLMRHQEDISTQRLEAKIGRTMMVLVETLLSAVQGLTWDMTEPRMKRLEELYTRTRLFRRYR